MNRFVCLPVWQLPLTASQIWTLLISCFSLQQDRQTTILLKLTIMLIDFNKKKRWHWWFSVICQMQKEK